MEKPYPKRVWLFLCRIFSVITPQQSLRQAPSKNKIKILAQLYTEKLA